MCKKIKLCLCFLFLVFLSFQFSKKSFAVNTFIDNFDNLNNWDIISNGFENSWFLEDSKLIGSVGSHGNSFILSKDNNYQGKFNITYKATNQVGIDQELLFGVNKNNPNFYLINVRFYEPGWPSDGANEVKLFNCFSFTSNICSQKAVQKISGFNLQKNKEYLFRLEVDGGQVKFYIDNILILDYLSGVTYSGNVGFWNWGGDYSGGVKNIFDDFIVEYGDFNTPTSTPIPTPTPTNTSTPTPTETPVPTETPTPTKTPIPTETPIPTPIPKNKKIFILPGLGASWNSEAIVFGANIDDDQWKMTPFVNNYDGLIELLENNDLVRNKDFYVWNYDWRKNLSDIESNFNEFVESKHLDNNDEIYLVGHSLGGLVARLWAVDNENNYEIKEVITLGSPHLGSLDSYSVWNGSEVLINKGISSVVFKILLGLQNKSFVIKDLEKVRTFAPIVKDLLPIFDYTSKNDHIMSWQSLESKNDNLYNKNQSVNNLGTRLNLFVGVGQSTPSILKLGKRTVFDKALGLWPDGRILNFDTNDGDGTVLENSAKNNSLIFTELNSDHGGIVYNSLSNISEKLGLVNRNINSSYVDNFSNSLFVFIGSPATGKLICKGKIFEEKEGFILAPNQNFNKCDLELSPTEDGIVHLVFGNTRNDNWNYIEKEVVADKKEKLQIYFNQGKVVPSQINKSFLFSLLERDLKQLGLNKAVTSLYKNDFSRVVAYVFKYREMHDEKIVSQRILENLLIISSINSNDRKIYDYKFIDNHIEIIEKIVNLREKHWPVDENSANAFLALKKLETEVKQLILNKTYPNFQTVHALMLGYSREVL